MDYLTLITQQKQDKLALIEDEEKYTYARLAQAARELRSKADFSAPAIFIHESSIARQLMALSLPITIGAILCIIIGELLIAARARKQPSAK